MILSTIVNYYILPLKIINPFCIIRVKKPMLIKLNI